METARETAEWRMRGKVRYVDMRNRGEAPATAATIAVTVQQLSKDRRWLQDVGAQMPAVKAVVDGIVEAGLIPDDNPQYLTALTFLRPDICGRDGLRVTIETTGRAA